MAAKSFPQQICDLYNAANPTLPHPLTPADIEYGSRSEVPPEENNGKNFIMDITAKQDSQFFTGNVRLTYNRIKLNLGTTTALETDFESGTESILSALNTKLQQFFPDDMFTVEDDYNYATVGWNTEPNAAEPEKYDLVFTLSPNHMKFFATDPILRIVITPAKVDLATTNGELDGFSIPG